jgi:hypothetical protein
MSIRFNLRVASLGVLLVTLFFSPLSLAQITFERTYGGAAQDWGSSVQQTSDGGYIITGSTESYGEGRFSNVYLIRTGSFGDTLWTRIYGGLGPDEGNSVKQTLDGGFIIVGNTIPSSEIWQDIYLIKTDLSGDTLWTKAYGDEFNDESYSIQQTLPDGGYIIAGSTERFGALSDVYLIKTDPTGDTLWTRTYGGSGADYAVSVKQTVPDGGYIMAGYTTSFGEGGDVYLIKVNSSGDTLWTKSYGSADWEVGSSVDQTSDGGYIIAGWTNFFGAGLQDVYLIRTDASGETLWTKTHGGSGGENSFSVQQTSDGGFIIAGATNSFGMGSSDVYLIKTDSSGDSVWTKTYGGTSTEIGVSVHQTLDDGYIIAGYTSSFGEGGFDVYLIKTCPDGSIGRCKRNCFTFDDLDETISDAEIDNKGVRRSLQAKANNARRQYDRGNLKTSGNVLCALLHEMDGQDGKHIDPVSAQDLRECVISLAENLGIPLPCQSKKSVAHVLYPNFPNPVRFSTHISYTLPGIRVQGSGVSERIPVHLAVYDVTGRLVKTLVDREQEVGYYSVEWDGKDGRGREAPSGIYFYRLQSGTYTATKKLILLK